MTRTAQRVRQTTDTCTEVQSMTLVRNILRSSISSIAYLRYLFPEDSFSDTQLAGLKIKALVPNSNPEIAALTEWMEKGVFDAIEKHYLKALVFSIFAEFNNPSTLLESYTFKFQYPSDGNISMGMTATVKGQAPKEMSYMTREQIQQAWCTMIRTLITLSHTLPPLPTERHIAMRLYYFDDVTPEDYNPPGFTKADDAPNFEFITESECVEIGGSVSTKFHAVSLRLDTAMPNYVETTSQNNTNANDTVNFVEDEKVEIAILAIAECGKDKFCRDDIIERLGINKNNQKFDEILSYLIDIGFINEVEGGYVVIKNKVNQERIDATTLKYNSLDTDPAESIVQE